MAIKNNTATGKSNKNSNRQIKGTMPKDMLLRHKLTGNLETENSSNASRADRTVRKFARMIKTYRQLAHGCHENRLSSSLRRTAHYFTIPMSRADSDNLRDKRGLVESNVDNNTVGSAGNNS